VAYARELGFVPHVSFARAAAYLEEWRGPSVITFGRDEKAVLHAGPYDDAFSIIQMLDRTVGRGNYHYMVAVG
jgi:hypothetical protein